MQRPVMVTRLRSAARQVMTRSMAEGITDISETRPIRITTTMYVTSMKSMLTPAMLRETTTRSTTQISCMTSTTQVHGEYEF